jgi:LysR family hca operon transcriptional activator
MELRHLRYFVAVAEEGSLTVAAERRLHTSQPSLSRQIKDLEYEVGAPLLVRSVRGIELTAAGQAFLNHARLALSQVDAGIEAARRAARPAKMQFALGFLTGQEMDWLPAAMQILKAELCNIDVTLSSQYSPDLADGLATGRLDMAFLRREADVPDVEYQLVASEPLVVMLPSDHVLATRQTIGLADLGEVPFIGVSQTAPTLKKLIDRYFETAGMTFTTQHLADNIGMFMSLVASTRGFALMPAYTRNFLPWSVTSRPLEGTPPTIDLVVGYNRKNTSPVLKLFLSRIGDLIERVSPTLLADHVRA